MLTDLRFSLVLILLIIFSSCTKKDDGIALVDGDKTKIELTISNIKQKVGYMQIGLYNSSKDWERDIPNARGGSELIVERLKVESSEIKFNFEDLDPGTYALSIYHDENDNNAMDRQLGLFPLEPYCFSNNFKPQLSPPAFGDCSFEVIENKTTEVDVELIH